MMALDEAAGTGIKLEHRPMPLPANHQDALHALVSDILRDSSLELSACNDVAEVMAAIIRTTHAAMARVAEEWNSMSSTITQRLPPEVLAECFSWLGTKSLTRAARVSRAWRTVALSEPALWTDLDILVDDSAPEDSAFPALQSLLRRSGRLHVNLHISGSARRPLLMQTIEDSLVRIRSIDITGQVQLRLRSNARTSVLETIDSVDHVHVPDAPALRSVVADTFHFGAPASPLTALRTFTGSLINVVTLQDRDIGASDAHLLFVMCPRLETLELRRLTPASMRLLPPPPIPASLVNLSLVALHTDVQLSVYLDAWRSHALRRLTLSTGEFLGPALALFISIHRGPWRMTVEDYPAPLRFTLETADADDGPVFRTLHSHTPETLRVGRILQTVQPHLARLTELVLTDQGSFAALHGAALALPALERLTMPSTALFGRWSTEGRISASRLAALTVRLAGSRWSGEVDGVVERLPRVLRHNFFPEDLYLQRIELRGPTDDLLDKLLALDLEPLLACTATLYAEDRVVERSLMDVEGQRTGR